MPSELLLLASNVNEEPCLQRSIDMKPSPFSILFAALVLAAVVCAQSNPPAPQQASGAPDTPIAGPQSSNPSKETKEKEDAKEPTTAEEPQQPKTVILDSSATS